MTYSIEYKEYLVGKSFTYCNQLWYIHRYDTNYFVCRAGNDDNDSGHIYMDDPFRAEVYVFDPEVVLYLKEHYPENFI